MRYKKQSRSHNSGMKRNMQLVCKIRHSLLRFLLLELLGPEARTTSSGDKMELCVAARSAACSPRGVLNGSINSGKKGQGLREGNSGSPSKSRTLKGRTSIRTLLSSSIRSPHGIILGKFIKMDRLHSRHDIGIGPALLFRRSPLTRGESMLIHESCPVRIATYQNILSYAVSSISCLGSRSRSLGVGVLRIAVILSVAVEPAIGIPSA